MTEEATRRFQRRAAELAKRLPQPSHFIQILLLEGYTENEVEDAIIVASAAGTTTRDVLAGQERSRRKSDD